jgi:hypothetical protein
MLTSGAQMLALPGGTWARLLGWMALGFVVYYAYGRHHVVPYAARRAKLLGLPVPVADDRDGPAAAEVVRLGVDLTPVATPVAAALAPAGGRGEDAPALVRPKA